MGAPFVFPKRRISGQAFAMRIASFMMITALIRRISAIAGKSKQKTKDWRAKVRGLLKAELKRRNLSYADLAERLGTIGVKDNERNISNKISRGSFTAVFFLQCLEVVGCKTIHFEDI
jgi:uncharacterized protein DUF6471